MKKTILVIAGLISLGTQAQSFVNGSFEKNSHSGKCGYNLKNDEITSTVEGTHAFGGYEAVDILKAGCIIESVADGEVALGVANEPSNPDNGEAISLELTETLKEGKYYKISFKVMAITKYGPQGDLLIGSSSKANDFGVKANRTVSAAGKWGTITFIHTAEKDDKYITIKPVPGVKSWNIVDDFSIEAMTDEEADAWFNEAMKED